MILIFTELHGGNRATIVQIKCNRREQRLLQCNSWRKKRITRSVVVATNSIYLLRQRVSDLGIWPRKVGLKVGRRLTKPSSPEQVGDAPGTCSIHLHRLSK